MRPICRDCRHYEEKMVRDEHGVITSRHVCNRLSWFIEDIVSGEKERRGQVSCRTSRSRWWGWIVASPCGPRGKHFDPLTSSNLPKPGDVFRR